MTSAALVCEAEALGVYFEACGKRYERAGRSDIRSVAEDRLAVLRPVMV